MTLLVEIKLNEFFFFQIKLAQLLGFKTYSEYSMVLLCAKTPQNVDTFLNKLAEKMRILQEKEKEILLNYKKEEV
jgi:Zn-dependent oligopeptidase